MSKLLSKLLSKFILIMNNIKSASINDNMIKLKILFFNRSSHYKIVINKKQSVELLKKIIEELLIKLNNSIMHPNIQIIYKDTILKNGSLEENNIINDSCIKVLPLIQTGLSGFTEINMEKVSELIINYISTNPNDITSLKKFLNYHQISISDDEIKEIKEMLQSPKDSEKELQNESNSIENNIFEPKYEDNSDIEPPKKIRHLNCKCEQCTYNYMSYLKEQHEKEKLRDIENDKTRLKLLELKSKIKKKQQKINNFLTSNKNIKNKVDNPETKDIINTNDIPDTNDMKDIPDTKETKPTYCGFKKGFLL